MVGKIHLSGKMQGFDYWEALPGQGKYVNPTFVTEGDDAVYEGYTTDIITDRALNWLEIKRDKNKPFMLMIHHKAPHRNWIPAERHMDKYADIEIPEPDNLFDDYSTRTTAAHGQAMEIDRAMSMGKDLKTDGSEKAQQGQYARRNKYFAENTLEGKELVKWKDQTYLKDYLRCTWAVDENVGRVLKSLKEQGLEENTIVMYSSDQGFFMGEHGWFDKRFMYEESFGTPLLARWPGVIKPGSVNSDLVQNIDFAETFLDLAGAPIPDDMQGRSIVPLLTGKTPPDWRTSLYYHYYEYPGGHSVRRHEGVADKRYKLIRFYGVDVPNGEEWEFYDLETDPSEMNNTYNNPENAAKVAEMKKELDRLKVYYKVDEPPPQKVRNQSAAKQKKSKK
jgi:arylsulfatase A-like enzyme